MVYLFISIKRVSTIDNLFVTFGQSSTTKILAEGDGRKWGNHRGHKSSLRHISSRVWFTQTIDTAATSGHIHICLSCGSRLAGARFDSSIVGKAVSWNCFQCETSDFHKCVYLTWFIWWLRFGMTVLPDHEWPFGESPPLLTVLYEGRKHRASFFCSLLLLLKDPHCDPQVMRSRPLQRWLSVSITHSLWNLSCAEDSFHLPAQSKMGNAATH